MGYKNNNLGLTIIEVLVASSILIIGLMAILSSSIALLSATHFSRNYLIATDLAREGIEIVRNKRDENFLLDRNFDYLNGLENLRDIDQAILEFDNGGGDFNGRFKIIEISDDINTCISNATCQLRFFPDQSLYGNGSINGNFGEKVNFYRLLTFSPIICSDAAVPAGWIYTGIGDPDDYVCSEGDVIGLQVVATVSWYKGEELQSLEITDELYAWQ